MDVERDCDSPVSNQSMTVVLNLDGKDNVDDDSVRPPTELTCSSGCPRTELSSGCLTELTSGCPLTELSYGCPTEQSSPLPTAHDVAHPHTEYCSGFFSCSLGLTTTEHRSRPPSNGNSPVADSTACDYHSIQADQSEGHVASIPLTCVGCHRNNMCPVDVHDLQHQDIDPVIVQHRPGAPYASTVSEGQSTDPTTRPDDEPLDQPCSTSSCVASQPVHHNACPDRDEACASPSQHVFAHTGARGNHHFMGDHISGQTVHRSSDASREPPDSTPISMSALTTSGVLWLTFNADDDTTRLHPPLDDDGPAYYDPTPTWTPPPWTCGPRPPSFLTAGGPLSRPREGAPRAASQNAPDVRAPTQVPTDLAFVDVVCPHVPWITDPSAPPDSTGLAVPPHPPMSPVTPG